MRLEKDRHGRYSSVRLALIADRPREDDREVHAIGSGDLELSRTGGVREAAGEEWDRMSRWFNDVGYEADIPAVRKLYPQLTTFEQYLRNSPSWRGRADRAPAVERGRGESTTVDAPRTAP